MAARERINPGSAPGSASGSDPGSEIRAYIGLGSNLGVPLSQIGTAVRALGELPDTTVIACSGIYRNRAMTDPIVHPEILQPDYLNAVAAIDTRLAVEDLLQALLNQEAVQGRRRSTRHWEARCIDLDLLLYGELQLESRTLTVPHPGLHGRPFVIHPLAEIAPLAFIPGFGTATQVAETVSKKSLTLVRRGSELVG